MGSAALEQQIGTPIENNLIALVVTNQIDKVIDQIQCHSQSNINWSDPINFKGDTILHYACAKNNIRLIQYLLKRFPELLKKVNNQNQYPQELTTNEEVKTICNQNISSLRNSSI